MDTKANEIVPDAVALRPVRLFHSGLRTYSATTFPKNPFGGCNLIYRRMKACGMLILDGDYLLDILDAEGDIIHDFFITKRGFEYLISKLHFVRED